VADKALRIYCVVPWELSDDLHDRLRHHFRNDPGIEVIVERRARDRRSGADRRADAAESEEERRRIRNATGRRVGERRASVSTIETPTLPRFARVYSESIAFLERLEPSDQHSEDLDTARLVTLIQSGARDSFADLYMRYFDRVYSYLKIALDDDHAAEDATQQVFLKVMEALPNYERRSQPFRAWLFTIVRNHALKHLEKRSRVEIMDPAELTQGRGQELEREPAEALEALGWVSDRELLMLIERLPVAQRQVLLLRYMMDLTTSDIAAVLDRTTDDVRALQSRALRFLHQRLTALGRKPTSRERIPMSRRRPAAPVLRARRYEHR
jgi:RNA polymerase sigma-70 factor (ECF subfamily)